MPITIPLRMTAAGTRRLKAVAVTSLTTIMVLGTSHQPAFAAPSSVQMPFPCAETWYASTYTGHSPSQYAIDWNLIGNDAGRSVRAGVTGTATVMSFDAGGYGYWVEI